MVCRLVKALYGFKQASKTWYIKMDKHLQDRVFRGSFYDFNLYVKRDDGDVVLLVIYVDDIIITSSKARPITKVKSKLCSTFDTTDLDLLHYCLGVEVQQINVYFFFIN